MIREVPAFCLSLDAITTRHNVVFSNNHFKEDIVASTAIHLCLLSYRVEPHVASKQASFESNRQAFL
jgi:hypothetical protein